MNRNPINDRHSVRIGDVIDTVASELQPLGGEVPQALLDFQAVHSRFSDEVHAYEQVNNELQIEQQKRQDARRALVQPMQAAWMLVPSLGASLATKSREQIAAERSRLFLYGRPNATAPGDRFLIAMADTLIERLTDGSKLASLWPAENLEAISTGRDAFLPALQAWQRADLRCSMALTRLEPHRVQWYKSLSRLRDLVKTEARHQELPNRWASLFRYRRPKRASPAEGPPET